MAGSINRRSFIKSAAAAFAGAVGFFGLYKFLTPKTADNDILLSIKSDDVPEGGALIYKEMRLAVLKSGGSLTAMSLTCTHLGCTVSLDGDRFACPCHGSIFALDGSVVKGPAEKSLKKYSVSEEGGVLTVYGRERA